MSFVINGDTGLTFPDATSQGSAPFGKQTIWIPAGAMTPRTTNGAAPTKTQLATNGTMVSSLAFDTATIEYAQFQIRMPKSWDESNITYTVVWSNATSGGTNACAWVLRAKAFGDAEGLDSAWGTGVTIIDTSNAVTDSLNITAESTALTISAVNELEYVIFEIYRDVNNASDLMSQDALLLGVTINYTTNVMTDA